MLRLRLTPALVCLLCVVTCHLAAAGEPQPRGEQPAAKAAPSRLVTLARHFCYLRVLSGPPASEDGLEVTEEARGQEQRAVHRPVQPPPRVDASALSLKLAPGKLKRRGIGFELSEFRPLGHQETRGRRACRAADHFVFGQKLAHSCLMSDRPDGQGVEFSLGYPVQEGGRLMVGMQAEEGGRLGKSDLRSLIGFSFSF